MTTIAAQTRSAFETDSLPGIAEAELEIVLDLPPLTWQVGNALGGALLSHGLLVDVGDVLDRTATDALDPLAA